MRQAGWSGTTIKSRIMMEVERPPQLAALSSIIDSVHVALAHSDMARSPDVHASNLGPLVWRPLRSGLGPTSATQPGGFRAARAFAGDPAGGLILIRVVPPAFGCSISKAFVFRTRSLSLRDPKVLGSKSGARLVSPFPTSPRPTHPSSLSIWAMTFLIIGVALSGGWSSCDLAAASWLFAAPPSRFSV